MHVNERNTNDTKRKRIKVSCPVTEHITSSQQQGQNQVDPSSSANRENAESDGGHRFGNFHEYYKFHPVDHRMPLLEPLLRHIMLNHGATAPSLDTDKQEESKDHVSVPPIFRYLDVGCNEGDLTLAVAEQLRSMACNAAAKPSADVHVLGIDLDPVLIDRARAKVSAARLAPLRNQGLEHSVLNRHCNISFETVNVLQEGIPQCHADADGCAADLTSLFSTTMWLHIHGGDDGLRRVLEQTCDITRHWILLEVQPSKCYGKAALRWRRKMGDHSPLDVSTKRLQLRATIDEAVEETLQQHGFERVRIVTDEQREEDARNSLTEGRYLGINTADKSKEIELKTPWNRSCRLYRRVESLNKAKR